MKKKCAVWDCDEVLLDHIGGLYWFVKDHYDIHPTSQYPVSYDLRAWLGGITSVEVQEIIKHFNQNSYEFGLLEPLEHNTVQIMQELRDKFPDVHFAVLTKSGTRGHGEVLRKVNLMNAFGSLFDDIIIVEMQESKKAALQKLQNQYDVKFLVDDYIKNIETAMDLDIPAVMMRSSHNLDYKNNHEGFKYCNNWADLRLEIYSMMK